MRKALVSLPEGFYDIFDKELMGKIGESYSEIIRSIVVSYLSEKGYMNKSDNVAKKK